MNNKSILITQNQLRNYSGSEVVTLELVEYFLSIGWDVTVLTHYFGNPIKNDIEATGATVVLTDSNDADDVTMGAFDIVWVHHYTFTPKMVMEMAKDLSSTKIVFHHMSFTEPLEAPIFYAIEDKIADIIAFNSEETRDEIMKKIGLTETDDRFFILDNPAPDDFFNEAFTMKNETIKTVAVISNHPPQEILSAVKILKENQIDVTFYGRKNDGIIDRVVPSVIRDYDAVISIGKTVQYCLASKTPVYCYDRFGGPGFINIDNFNKAHYHNFSGRGFDEKTDQEIACDFTKDYERISKNSKYVSDSHSEEFKLSTKISKVVTTVKQNRIKNLDAVSLYSLGSYVSIMRKLAPQHAKQVYVSKASIESLTKLLAANNKDKKRLVTQMDDAKDHLDRVLNSRTMRIANLIKSILMPFRAR